MPTRAFCLAALILAAVMATGSLLAATTRRATSGAAPGRVEVAIANTRRVEFISKINGHRYALTVALPFNKAPAKGYAVLYVLDGYWYFASAAEVVRVFGNPSGVVVVGIGYPDDEAYARRILAERGPVPAVIAGLPPSRSSPYQERLYDLTLPVSDEDLSAQALPGTPKQWSRNLGGLDDFLKIIETEVKPRVARVAPIDTTNQALFGHSLGGLAALHALFVEPHAFRTYIIASPSIWWNNKAVLVDEGRFAAAVTSGKAQPRVLVSVGSEESTPTQIPGFSYSENAANQTQVRKARMVENANELVERLKALRGGPGYRVEDCAVFDKEQHSASPWSALARGIPFAFADIDTPQ